MGIADNSGIPWLGLLPTDENFFREKTLGGILLMGYGEYLKKKRPFTNRRNLVATTKNIILRDGFEKINDARQFLQSTSEDIWVSGGAGLYSSTLDLANELYLTKINYDFHCTKFFPKYQALFRLDYKSNPLLENDLEYHFEVWKNIKIKY